MVYKNLIATAARDFEQKQVMRSGWLAENKDGKSLSKTEEKK
jgi:hypothetical protein